MISQGGDHSIMSNLTFWTMCDVPIPSGPRFHHLGAFVCMKCLLLKHVLLRAHRSRFHLHCTRFWTHLYPEHTAPQTLGAVSIVAVQWRVLHCVKARQQLRAHKFAQSVIFLVEVRCLLFTVMVLLAEIAKIFSHRGVRGIGDIVVATNIKCCYSQLNSDNRFNSDQVSSNQTLNALQLTIVTRLRHFTALSMHSS